MLCGVLWGSIWLIVVFCLCVDSEIVVVFLLMSL